MNFVLQHLNFFSESNGNMFDVIARAVSSNAWMLVQARVTVHHKVNDTAQYFYMTHFILLQISSHES